MAVVATCVCLSWPARGEDAGRPSSRAAAAVAATRPTAAEIDRAAAELGDARWQIRREAGFRLIDAGWDSVPALRRAYRETRNHEVRLRIRELAETIFSNRHAPGPGGFLGIRQRPRLHTTDPRVPQGVSWIEVLEVFRDTAADRVGLRVGDLITRCDGQPIPEDPTGQSFSGLIGRRRPGEEAVIEVRRGTDDPVRLAVRLGCRPMAVLSVADPELYESVRAAFSEWWQELFESPAGRPRAATHPAATRPQR